MPADKTLLIIGGAGGVGSLAIPFAKHNSKVKMIATASEKIPPGGAAIAVQMWW
jgi:NADPH:quinone reductase-like Zn-dependent oxidoreductase